MTIELNIPTERLALRTMRPGDAPEVEHWVSDWDVARMTSRIPHPYPRGGAAAWIALQADRRAAGQEVVFAMEYLGHVAGCVGLHAAPGLPAGAMEMGYWVGAPYWGYGLATEAGRAVLGFAFAHLRLARVVASHFADNPASGRVLTKLGFAPVGRGRLRSAARCGEVETVLMALPRDAWAGRRV